MKNLGNGNKIKVGAYATAGLLIAVIIIASLSFSGVKFPVSNPLSEPGGQGETPEEVETPGRGFGTLIILVTDAPAELKNLNLTIDKLSIHGSGGNWIDLELLGEGPVYFDLLALRNISMCLSVTQVPAGNYTMLRMHVLKANATFANGEVADLRVPSEEIKVLFKPHLEMESGGAITVTIDLEPDTVHIARNRNLNLKPVVKAVVKAGG